MQATCRATNPEGCTRASDGRFCDGCETTILPAQVEYQFETTTADERVIRFHLGCAGLWEAYRLRIKIISSTPSE
jgi:hypothetical protein